MSERAIGGLGTGRVLKVGDWVYLKIQPYMKVSMAVSKNFKLSSNYYGPYLVQERIGVVA